MTERNQRNRPQSSIYGLPSFGVESGGDSAWDALDKKLVSTKSGAWPAFKTKTESKASNGSKPSDPQSNDDQLSLGVFGAIGSGAEKTRRKRLLATVRMSAYIEPDALKAIPDAAKPSIAPRIAASISAGDQHWSGTLQKVLCVYQSISTGQEATVCGLDGQGPCGLTLMDLEESSPTADRTAIEIVREIGLAIHQIVSLPSLRNLRPADIERIRVVLSDLALDDQLLGRSMVKEGSNIHGSPFRVVASIAAVGLSRLSLLMEKSGDVVAFTPVDNDPTFFELGMGGREKEDPVDLAYWLSEPDQPGDVRFVTSERLLYREREGQYKKSDLADLNMMLADLEIMGFLARMGTQYAITGLGLSFLLRGVEKRTCIRSIKSVADRRKAMATEDMQDLVEFLNEKWDANCLLRVEKERLVKNANAMRGVEQVVEEADAAMVHTVVDGVVEASDVSGSQKAQIQVDLGIQRLMKGMDVIRQAGVPIGDSMWAQLAFASLDSERSEDDPESRGDKFEEGDAEFDEDAEDEADI